MGTLALPFQNREVFSQLLDDLKSHPLFRQLTEHGQIVLEQAYRGAILASYNEKTLKYYIGVCQWAYEMYASQYELLEELSDLPSEAP